MDEEIPEPNLNLEDKNLEARFDFLMSHIGDSIKQSVEGGRLSYSRAHNILTTSITLSMAFLGSISLISRLKFFSDLDISRPATAGVVAASVACAISAMLATYCMSTRTFASTSPNMDTYKRTWIYNCSNNDVKYFFIKCYVEGMLKNERKFIKRKKIEKASIIFLGASPLMGLLFAFLFFLW